MSDFDLSQVLKSPESPECESCCTNMETDPDEVIKFDVDLQLVVSPNPCPLHHVVTLLLTANKMKKFLQCKGHSLSEDDRYRMIVDNLIEKTVIERTGTSSSGEKITLNRLRSWECNLTDSEKKDIICADTTTNMELRAVTLKGGNLSHKVKFKMGLYGPSGAGMTVALSLINSKLYISCIMKDDKAVLHLEKCDEKELKTISNDGDMERFLFFVKEDCGTRFESVKCRGWFISTSYKEELQPLEMCKVDAVNRETTFSMR